MADGTYTARIGGCQFTYLEGNLPTASRDLRPFRRFGKPGEGVIRGTLMGNEEFVVGVAFFASRALAKSFAATVLALQNGGPYCAYDNLGVEFNWQMVVGIRGAIRFKQVVNGSHGDWMVSVPMVVRCIAPF